MPARKKPQPPAASARRRVDPDAQALLARRREHSKGDGNLPKAEPRLSLRDERPADRRRRAIRKDERGADTPPDRRDPPSGFAEAERAAFETQAGRANKAKGPSSGMPSKESESTLQRGARARGAAASRKA